MLSNKEQNWGKVHHLFEDAAPIRRSGLTVASPDRTHVLHARALVLVVGADDPVVGSLVAHRGWQSSQKMAHSTFGAECFVRD